MYVCMSTFFGFLGPKILSIMGFVLIGTGILSERPVRAVVKKNVVDRELYDALG